MHIPEDEQLKFRITGIFLSKPWSHFFATFCGTSHPLGLKEALQKPLNKIVNEGPSPTPREKVECPFPSGIKFAQFAFVKQQTAPLISFITDYRLEKQNGCICFKASVHFQGERHWFKFISPVHIITISLKQLDVIYLLNPEIDEKKIHTIFTNNQHFFYSKNRSFEIRGRSQRYGRYSLTIIPINSSCDEEIMDELHSKTYN